MNKSKKVIISLAVASLSLGSLIYAEPMLASTNPIPEKAAQIKQTPRKIGKNEQTGGLVQTLLPRALPMNQLQSTNTGSSLGSSGSTDNLPQTQSSASTPIVGAGSLPTLWDPLNPNSGNYGQTTPVLDQGLQNICWSFTGSDTISKSALTQLGVNQPLSPVYYDYLSAVNAFSGINNPTGIILPVSSTSFAPRQLSTDGNTLDYVPTMSVQGYDPVSSADFPQPLPATTAIDTPTSQAAFNQLPKSNLHVSDSYKITGFAPNNLPSTPTSIMNRVNQIKQMVYQYGAVQFGLEADVSLYAPYYNATTNASYVPYSAAQAGSNLVYSYSGQLYLNQDHELQIVGYDDSYSRTHFLQNPGMDGAFVVKNTWGMSWGDNGYLYVSYADVYIAGSEIYADEVSATKAGEKTYSATNISPEASTWYYPLSSSNGSIVNTIFSNTYTSQNLSGGQVEQLNSISAYIDQAGTTVQVLYKMGAANSGTYTNLGSYTFTDAGYQTIPLSQTINLPNNSSYTVAIKIMSLPIGCTTLNVPIQVHSNGSTGVYPILTTGNSWMNYGNKWINLSSNEDKLY